tara:strand:- start:3833 stop:4318 length:486 start_codon:yes stop_codon:yes gene_type:complete
MTNYSYKNFLFLVLLTTSSFTISESKNTMEGYWLTSQSIVEVKNCKKNLCATIEHIFVEDDIDPKSIMDSNNKKRSLRDRPLIGINLLEDFPSYALDKKVLKNGKIYDPGRGRTFKSNLYLLDDGTLKVEGCLMGICDHEIWQPLVVTINEDGTRTAEPMN